MWQSLFLEFLAFQSVTMSHVSFVYGVILPTLIEKEKFQEAYRMNPLWMVISSYLGGSHPKSKFFGFLSYPYSVILPSPYYQFQFINTSSIPRERGGKTCFDSQMLDKFCQFYSGMSNLWHTYSWNKVIHRGKGPLGRNLQLQGNQFFLFPFII